MKVLRCRDVGFECEHEIRAEREAEILQRAAEHVQTVHKVELTPELTRQVTDLILEE